MIVLNELVQTCSVCPSQWEGVSADGERVYIRYRHGHLTASVGPTIEEAVRHGWPDSHGRLIYSESHGDGLDGVMDEQTMLFHLRGVLRYGDHDFSNADAERPYLVTAFFANDENGDARRFADRELAIAFAKSKLNDGFEVEVFDVDRTQIFSARMAA